MILWSPSTYYWEVLKLLTLSLHLFQLEQFVLVTGAGRLEEIIFGLIPQVLPLWISVSLYRFESNIRSATVLGMVGGGGIGVSLWETMRGFQYTETATIMLVIIVAVTVLDMASQTVRKRFI